MCFFKDRPVDEISVLSLFMDLVFHVYNFVHGNGTFTGKH